MPEMTNTQLAAKIRELSGKATAGEWKWEDWSEDDGPNLTTLAAPPEARTGGPSGDFPTLGQRVLCAEEPMENPADAELIVTLRNHATRLAEAVERESDVATAVAAERARCAAIVRAARFGEIDGDFRGLIYWIEDGDPYPDEETL